MAAALCRSLQRLSAAAPTGWCVQLYCTLIVYSWCVQLYCTPIVYSWCVQLYSTLMQCTAVMYCCTLLTLHLNVYSYTLFWSEQLECMVYNTSVVYSFTKL